MTMSKMIQDGVYLHINNGGVSFKVTQDDELALEVEAGHFGHTTNHMKIYADQNALRRLGQMLIDAADQHDAKVSEYFTVECFGIDKETGKTKRYDGQENELQQFSQQQTN